VPIVYQIKYTVRVIRYIIRQYYLWKRDCAVSI